MPVFSVARKTHRFSVSLRGPEGHAMTLAVGDGCAAGARDVSAMRFFHGGELGVKPKEAS